MSIKDRMYSYERWYALDKYDTREHALAEARARMRTDEPGQWVYQIRKGQTGGYVLYKARRMSDSEMSRTRDINRRMRQDASGQRRMF